MIYLLLLLFFADPPDIDGEWREVGSTDSYTIYSEAHQGRAWVYADGAWAGHRGDTYYAYHPDQDTILTHRAEDRWRYRDGDAPYAYELYECLRPARGEC